MQTKLVRGSIYLIVLALLLAACGSTPSTGTSTTTQASTGGATTTAGATSGAATSASAGGATTVAPAGTSGSAGGTTSGDAIPIGVGVAQTSNVALLGQEQVIGAKIAETYFNQHGGVNGRPIKLVYQDTGGDEAGTINAFQTLINQNNVVGIIGPTLSQQAFAADPIADRAKVPVIGPSNTAAGIPQIGPFVARVSAPVSKVAPAAVKAALKIKPDIKKVAVLYAQNDAFSKSETLTFQQTVTSTQGLQLLPVQTFQTTDTDFTTQATNVLGGQPDLVIISGLAQDGGSLVKQLRDLGYKGLIIGGNGFNTPNIFPVCKAQCDGILIAQAYNYSLDNPINNDFRAAFKAQQNREPAQFSGQMFAAVQVFVEALREVDKTTKLSSLNLADLRTKLNDQLLKGKYTTTIGDISFTPEGDIVQTQFYVAQIKMQPDGKTGSFSFLQ